MRIAIIAPTFIPAKRANTLQVMKMAQAFLNLGHQVQLSAPESSLRTRDLALEGVDIAYHYGLPGNMRIDYLPAKPNLRRYDYSWHAVRWARHSKADIIYTRLPQAAALAAYRGYKLIFEVHDFPQGFIGPLLFKRFLQGVGSKRLVVISTVLADDLYERFGSPEGPPLTLVLPDGVDLDRYSKLPGPEESRRKLFPTLKQHLGESGLDQFSNRFTAGYTGHLYPGRGMQLILELAARIPEVNFLIVGGELEDVYRVKEIAIERGLRNVIMTGFVPNAELPHYQAACDILLMPYQRIVAASSGGDIGRYLSPMKMFEYMACGRAICSSNLLVLQEVLSNEMAILLPPEKVDSWAAAVRELRDDPALRKQLANKAQDAAEQYSWDTRAQKILDGI
jgi:glycosyltransferase involved in cell wall biosynthesis